MTPRETFIAALERRPITGRVPTFELVFFPTREAFGKAHPSHRQYGQWAQMREVERELHCDDIADILIATAERYEQVHPALGKRYRYVPNQQTRRADHAKRQWLW